MSMSPTLEDLLRGRARLNPGESPLERLTWHIDELHRLRQVASEQLLRDAAVNWRLEDSRPPQRGGLFDAIRLDWVGQWQQVVLQVFPYLSQPPDREPGPWDTAIAELLKWEAVQWANWNAIVAREPHGTLLRPHTPGLSRWEIQALPRVLLLPLDERHTRWVWLLARTHLPWAHLSRLHLAEWQIGRLVERFVEEVLPWMESPDGWLSDDELYLALRDPTSPVSMSMLTDGRHLAPTHWRCLRKDKNKLVLREWAARRPGRSTL